MDLVEEAVEHYGITDEPEYASYILKDGRLLNGKIGLGKYRNVDHKEVGNALNDEGWDSINPRYSVLISFMLLGNIRLALFGGPRYEINVELMERSTEEQKERIDSIIRYNRVEHIILEYTTPTPSDYNTNLRDVIASYETTNPMHTVSKEMRKIESKNRRKLKSNEELEVYV